MKKQYYYIAGGLLLVYWFLKNQKAKQPVEKLATDTQGGRSIEEVQTVESEPLLISPSLQQEINQYTPGTATNGQNITVRYIAGTKKHYI